MSYLSNIRYHRNQVQLKLRTTEENKLTDIFQLIVYFSVNFLVPREPDTSLEMAGNV